MYDLAIKNGEVYISGEFVKANVYIKDEKIATISVEDFQSREIYDARGKWILPGFIDPHVHFHLTVGNWTSVDDFYTGSVAGAFGGITTFIDFTDPASNVDEVKKFFKERLDLAKDSVVDYAFHSTLANPTDPPEKMVGRSLNLGMKSIKIFTTYSATNRRTYDDYIDSLLKLSSGGKFTLAVHAENDDLVKRSEHGLVPYQMHSNFRPTVSELSEVLKLAQMSAYRNGKLYIVHVSSGITASEVLKRFWDVLGKNVILESCPHYFYLDNSYYSREDGQLYIMTPPLRSKQEVELLRESFAAIHTIGTDHCSFNRSDKLGKKYTKEIPMGIGGVEFSFVLMFTLFGKRVIDRFTMNVAKVFDLYPRKGAIRVGSDADLVVFDPDVEWVIEDHHGAPDYTPYEGFKVRGKVISTISRGRFVVKDGEFVGEKGWGEYLDRK